MSSNSDSETTHFIELSRYETCEAILAISPSEFIAVSQTGSIHKYSSTTRQWSKFNSPAKLPKLDASNTISSSLYDKASNRLFIARDGRDVCQLMSFNLETGAQSTYPQCNGVINTMVLIDDKIHIFGSLRRGIRYPSRIRHCILDIASGNLEHKVLSPMNVPYDYRDIMYALQSVDIYRVRALYCQSRCSILIGCTGNERYGESRDSSFFMEYSLKTQQYRYLEWTHAEVFMAYELMICTVNERYIIRFGFEERNIWVFDLRERRGAMSDITPPGRLSAWSRAVLLGGNTRDELAMSGYIRNAFKSDEMENVQEIPIQVVQLMSKWYCNEQLHLINEKDGSHWTIDVDKIIQSIARWVSI